MEPTYGRASGIDHDDPRRVNIGELTNRLNQIIQAITGIGSDEQDESGMAPLICEGAIFGYALFIQPSEWTFDWSGPRDGDGPELVLFPALLKMSNDSGHILPAPELIIPVTLIDGA